MTEIQIQPVRTRRNQRTFLTFPWRIYRDDPLWVPPLLPEMKKRMDPAQGAFLQHGEAAFFIARRGTEPVGTVCAAVDHKANETRDRKECVFGFFEYIEDYAVFEALLEQVSAWARVRGLTALRGPFNLDYEDGYGVLIEGRDRPPVLLCGHTAPYYEGFMVRRGFQPARGDNLAYEIKIDVETPALRQLSAAAERVRRRGRVTLREGRLDEFEAEVDRIHLLLNTALAHLPDHTPWQRESVEELLGTFKTIADPELILFADVDGQTVGFFPGLPNLNEAFQHANGLRSPWDYLQLWWHTRRNPKCLTIKSVLVLPEYWGSGVGLLLFDEMVKRVRARGYEWIDLSLTSADNPKTPMLAERLGARIYKRYRVYTLDIG